MNCQKCKKEIDYDSNFCKYCANSIREKCPECEKMELVERRFCETKVNKENKQKTIFLEKELGSLFAPKPFYPLIYLLPFVIVLVTLVTYSYVTINVYHWNLGEFNTAVILLFLAAIFGFGTWIPAYKMNKQKRKMAENNFQKKFPSYAEIIKKAERA